MGYEYMKQEKKIPPPNEFLIVFAGAGGATQHIMLGRTHWNEFEMALSIRDVGGFEINGKTSRDYVGAPMFVPYHNILSVQRVSRP